MLHRLDAARAFRRVDGFADLFDDLFRLFVHFSRRRRQQGLPLVRLCEVLDPFGRFELLAASRPPDRTLIVSNNLRLVRIQLPATLVPLVFEAKQLAVRGFNVFVECDDQVGGIFGQRELACEGFTWHGLVSVKDH